MSINCCVPGCESTDLIKTMFEFPRYNLELLEIWLNEIPGLETDIGQLDLDFSCICEDHFKPEEITTNFNYTKQLVNGAFPSIFKSIKISASSCRFCLKVRQGEPRKIDNEIKGYFESLTGIRVSYSSQNYIYNHVN